jgi:rhodanese-related sulfurtransferase
MAMKRIIGLVAGVMALFGSMAVIAAESPMTVDGATTVDAAKAKELFDSGVVFIDVRSDKDWAAGRIPDAVHIELKKVYNEQTLGAEAKKADPVVIYCNGHSCMRSSKASAKAVSWGYGQVYYFRDGFPAWKAAGYPVE